MKRLIPLALIASGCAPIIDVPASSSVYEPHQTLVAETVKLEGQTLVENQPLALYQSEGQMLYCSDMVSMDLDLYRCFAFEGLKLTHGYNPQDRTLEPLPQPIAIKQIAK